MLLKELLKAYGWTVSVATPNFNHVIRATEEGQGYVLVVDDTPDAPSAVSLRKLLTHPLTALMPTLVFHLESNKSEKETLPRIGAPVIVPKPMTPSSFVPGFLSVLRIWDQPPLLQLRQASYFLTAGQTEAFEKALTQLTQLPSTGPLAAIALAAHYRQPAIGNVKQAESILISALKQHSKHLGLMLSLGDLYMHVAMPKLAHRLFLAARTIFGNRALVMLPDLVQSHIMLGQNEEALKLLDFLWRNDFMTHESLFLMSKLLIAEGRMSDAERILGENKGLYRKFQIAWDQEAKPTSGSAA